MVVGYRRDSPKIWECTAVLVAHVMIIEPPRPHAFIIVLAPLLDPSIHTSPYVSPRRLPDAHFLSPVLAVEALSPHLCTRSTSVIVIFPSPHTQPSPHRSPSSKFKFRSGWDANARVGGGQKWMMKGWGG
ncbi:hypothetical protein Hypma_004262 [Hypsizygus marmoreus]|uniref:Uncharacterized protein n=1 Tax=Hypsizygus marmoreus TaxID=39966 RepID=A0A369J0J5_HYPMA|nr:hypothetical protein Hypma_004262 [Hypsizygus marmoreus]